MTNPHETFLPSTDPPGSFQGQAADSKRGIAPLSAATAGRPAPGSEQVRTAAYAALQAFLDQRQYVLPIAFRDELFVARGTLEGPVVRPVADPGDRFWDVLTWRLADGR